MSAPLRRLLSISLALAVLGGPVAVSASAANGAGGTRTGSHRLMLGVVAQTRGQVEQRERETGHALAGIRVFRRWGEPLFTADDRWARRTGHTLFVSIKSKYHDGRIIEWHDIATARPGSPLADEMHRQAKEIRDFGEVVYIIFNHEPSAHASRAMGTPADFVAAWRKIVRTYRADGVRNARYVWTMTDASFRHDPGAFYPGDAYVDDIAADAYNWYGCRGNGGPWRGLAELIEPQRRFGLEHPHKGLMLLEWGSVEDPARPDRKARWLGDVARLFAQQKYHQYTVVLHWDNRYTPQVMSVCDFDYRTSAPSLAAWRALAASPVFTATSPCDIGDCRRKRHGSTWPIPSITVGTILLVGLIGFAIWRRRRHRHR